MHKTYSPSLPSAIYLSFSPSLPEIDLFLGEWAPFALPHSARKRAGSSLVSTLAGNHQSSAARRHFTNLPFSQLDKERERERAVAYIGDRLAEI